MHFYALSGMTFALALGLIVLVLYSLRKANRHNLVAVAAASFAFVFSLGYTVYDYRSPADPHWIQQEFVNLSPTAQMFMAQYFQVRELNHSNSPITNGEFNTLLTQARNLAPRGPEAVMPGAQPFGTEPAPAHPQMSPEPRIFDQSPVNKPILI